MWISLFLSSILCFFLNSWLSLWIFLEINTLSFCVMVATPATKSKGSSEPMMKYFIIQSIASAILVLSMTFFIMGSLLPFLLVAGVATITTKLGSSPFHQWFISISKKMKWTPVFVLFSWQKLAPSYLLVFQMKKILTPFLMLSALMGSIFMYNKTQLKEILAFSSVFNLSWIFLGVSLSTLNFLQFLLIYWTTLIFPILYFKKEKLETMNEVKKFAPHKILILLSMASLAGVPPLLGFLAKWLILKTALGWNMGYLSLILLMLSTFNMYIYFRILAPATLTNSNLVMKEKTNTLTKKWIFLFMLANSFSLVSILS